MKIAAVFILVVCMLGCSDKDGLPSGILKGEKMQAVFWDIIRAEAYTAQFIKKDSLKNAAVENAKFQQQIFAMHSITRQDFYKSYQYYNKHTELMRILLDSITAKGEREKYTTLYSKKEVAKPFSLYPLPPLSSEPSPLPIPVLNSTNQVISPSQQSTHKFLPEP